MPFVGDLSRAIPILERRLQFGDQRDVVQRELDAARRAAGVSPKPAPAPTPAPGKPGKGPKHGKGGGEGD